MPLQPGTRLGPYEVLAPIGAPSDERYRASDTRTNRVVALRVLPRAVPPSADRDGFARDAGVISSLRHPHISAPLEVGHQDPATDFVVMEYVEGETLAARLARGSMELSEALQVAIAMADSLDKAHRRGIVHGSLSPSTVMLTSDGPKLLDFGVARLSEPFAAGADVAAASATMTSTRTSVASLSAVPAAAAAYVAPERLAGAPLDVRSDIFAAGAVIYETITGRPAFQEKTSALLIAAIQSVDPDPASTRQPSVPAALDHVIARCLAKDPKDRLQTAWDLLTQLRWIAGGGSRVGVPAPVVSRRRFQEPVAWAAAAVASVVAVVLVPSALSSFGDVPEPAAVRYVVAGLSGGTPPITISPDGRWVAGSDQGGRTIFGVSPGSLTPQRLITAEATVFQPFWSPDSRSMAFFGQDGWLRRADISGGPPQTIAEAPGNVGNGSWSPEGVILFSSGGVIQRVLDKGGEPTPVTNVDENGEPITGENHLGPWFLPDGHHFLYVALSDDSAIYLADLDAPGRTRLIDADSRPMYAEPGYIVFNRGPTIFAQPFDAEALELTGEPIRVTDGVAMMVAVAGNGLERSANYAVSQTGALAFKYAGPGGADVTPGAASSERQLLLVGPSGAEQVGTGDFAGLDFAPDGERFAVHVHEGDGGDIWVFDPDQRRMQKLTFDASQENSGPVWSPDGTRIAFASRRDGQWGLYVRPADGSGVEERLVESSAQKVPMSWSPDGALLVYIQVDSGGKGDIWAVPLGGGEPFALLETGFDETSADISPDGRWMAYASDETGTSQVFITQFPEGPAKRQVTTDAGREPRWIENAPGLGLVYIAGPNVMSVEIDTAGATPRPANPRAQGRIGNPNLQGHFGVYHRLAVSDGPQVLISQPPGVAASPGRGRGAGRGGAAADAIRARADATGSQGTAGTAVVTVVLNWPQMLEER